MTDPKSGRRLKSVLFLLPNLSGGGAERTAVNLYHSLDKNRYRVRFALIQRTGPYLKEVEEDDVLTPEQIGLSFIGGLDSLNDDTSNPIKKYFVPMLRTITYIRRLIKTEQPDILLSYMTGLNVITAFSMLFVRCRKPIWIAREGNHFFEVLKYSFPNRWLRNAILLSIKWTYRRADKIVTVTQGAAKTLRGWTNRTSKHIHGIENPIDLQQIHELSQQDSPLVLPEYPIVFMGRLNHQKGIFTLIEAFKFLHKDNDCDLVVMGEGSLEPKLAQAIQSSGLTKRIQLIKFQANPWSILSRCKCLALPSLWEGFPHVIVEAMACGVPVVASDCEYGPPEIIQDGQNGLLFQKENSTDLAEKILTLSKSASLRTQLVAQGKKTAQKYEVGQVAKKYEALFEEALSERG